MSRLIFHGDKVLRRVKKEAPKIEDRISESIADKMRRLVPVKTGKLKASIEVTDDGIEVGEDYAGAVEFGTATKAAQPFVRPAIEQFNRADLGNCI